MKQSVLFVLLEPFADWEASYLSSALHMLAGDAYEVKTVSLTKGPVLSIGGFRVVPDYTIDTVPSHYAALILIGGMSWRSSDAKQIIPLVQDALERDKILGGICDAAGFLSTIGALNHVNHTGNDFNDIKQWAGEMYIGESKYLMQQAVRDCHIITANGTATLEFAKEVLLALHAASEKKITEWFQFHKLGYYKAAMPDMH